MPLKTVFTREQIAARLEELAQEIHNRLGEAPRVKALAILNGGLWFAADLLRHLPLTYHLDTMRASSYGMEKNSSGTITWHQKWPDFTGQTVLIIDDVIDTGLTLSAICAKLREQGASRVYSVVAVDKRDCRQIDYHADFAAFTAGNDFLVGYGMDHAEQYRNLPFIAVLEP